MSSLIRCTCDDCKYNDEDGYCDKDVVYVSGNELQWNRLLFFQPICTDYVEREDDE